MNDTLNKKQKNKIDKIDKIVEMGAKLTPVQFFEQVMEAMGCYFIDCNPQKRSGKRQKIKI